MILRYIDTHQRELGTVTVRDGVPAMTGVAVGSDRLAVVEPGTMRRLTPADGEAWLRGLRAMCRSGYMRAVLDGETPAIKSASRRAQNRMRHVTVGKKGDVAQAVAAIMARKYNQDHPLRLPPEDLTLGQERYAVVLADDEVGSKTGIPSCAVCNYLADVGSFALRDAVQQLDAFLEEAGDDFGQKGIDELAPFPTMDMIDGLGVEELTALGIMVPGYHPGCRCSLAIV